ncbi:hypothetical protein J001_01519 [Cryptococcus neoformans]|nr:hypothetical protein J001_01519 [Cryptococcus neoformans var. grubii]
MRDDGEPRADPPFVGVGVGVGAGDPALRGMEVLAESARRIAAAEEEQKAKSVEEEEAEEAEEKDEVPEKTGGPKYIPTATPVKGHISVTRLGVGAVSPCNPT